MKAYQRYVKENQEEIQKALLGFLRVLYRPYDYEEHEQYSAISSAISKRKLAVMCSAKRSLDIMSRHEIEITYSIAEEIALSALFCATYMPDDLITDDHRVYLRDVSDVMLQATRRTRMFDPNKDFIIYRDWLD